MNQCSKLPLPKELDLMKCVATTPKRVKRSSNIKRSSFIDRNI